jgi:hypothetical protein
MEELHGSLTAVARMRARCDFFGILASFFVVWALQMRWEAQNMDEAVMGR